jgi:hypothetical protein
LIGESCETSHKVFEAPLVPEVVAEWDDHVDEGLFRDGWLSEARRWKRSVGEPGLARHVKASVVADACLDVYALDRLADRLGRLAVVAR